MTRLDWEKANRRDKTGKRRRPSGKRKRQRAEVRRRALQDFVIKHDLVCFVCKKVQPEWAKTGISERGPWAICTGCVDKRL